MNEGRVLLDGCCSIWVHAWSNRVVLLSDVPDPPGRPLIMGFTSRSVNLSWAPSKDTHHSPITHYIIHVRWVMTLFVHATTYVWLCFHFTQPFYLFLFDWNVHFLTTVTMIHKAKRFFFYVYRYFSTFNFNFSNQQL